MRDALVATPGSATAGEARTEKAPRNGDSPAEQLALAAPARRDHRYVSPYVEFDREQWRRLRDATPLTITPEQLDRMQSVGERVSLREVEDIYLPLSRLINLQVQARQELHAATSTFLGDTAATVPFIIGIGGSVAVGKSVTARILRALLTQWPQHPHVDLVTTDGFLLSRAELERRDLMTRKGFPESYDRRSLVRFVSEVKAGAPEVMAPVYSHLIYDIVPGEYQVVRRPDIMIVEGLNVLQPAPRLSVSDLFDFSIYVDAHPDTIRSWYVNRFLLLRETAFADPASHFHGYATLDDTEAVAEATRLWETINEPNLVQNIRPTRGRAKLVLQKGVDHGVERVRLRKL